MITAKCVEKVRDKNDRIVSYILVDTQGNKTIMESDELKNQMFNNIIEVVNLKLTSDGRLIDKSEDEPQSNRVVRNATGDELIEFCRFMQLEAELHDISIMNVKSDYITINENRVQLTHWKTARYDIGSGNIIRALTVNGVGQDNGYNLVEIDQKKYTELKELVVGVACNINKEVRYNDTLCDYTIYIRESIDGKPTITPRTQEMEENINKVIDAIEYSLYSKEGHKEVKLFGLSSGTKLEEIKRAIVAFATSLLVMRALGVDTAEHCRWGDKVKNNYKLESSRKIYKSVHVMVERLLGMYSKQDSLVPKNLAKNLDSEIGRDYYDRLKDEKMASQLKTTEKVKESKGIKGLFNAFKR